MNYQDLKGDSTRSIQLRDLAKRQIELVCPELSSQVGLHFLESLSKSENAHMLMLDLKKYCHHL
jgi:hypothetical protein